MSRPPARKYDPGDRREKQEEMRRLAEMKRQREQAAAGPARPPAPAGAPEVRPGPKDARFEGRAAKEQERLALEKRRQEDLLFAVRMRVQQQSRWKQQAEAQAQTVESRLADLFGPGGKKPSREHGKRRK